MNRSTIANSPKHTVIRIKQLFKSRKSNADFLMEIQEDLGIASYEADVILELLLSTGN